MSYYKLKNLKKNGKGNPPFFHNNTGTHSYGGGKKRLYAISDMLRSQNIRTKVERGRIVLPNGEKYQEPIPKLESSDVLQIATQDVEPVDSVSTDPTQKKRVGNICKRSKSIII